VSNTQTYTDTQTTLRATSVAIGRIYAMHTKRPKTMSADDPVRVLMREGGPGGNRLTYLITTYV